VTYGCTGTFFDRADLHHERGVNCATSGACASELGISSFWPEFAQTHRSFLRRGVEFVVGVSPEAVRFRGKVQGTGISILTMREASSLLEGGLRIVPAQTMCPGDWGSSGSFG